MISNAPVLIASEHNLSYFNYVTAVNLFLFTSFLAAYTLARSLGYKNII
jgi:hypothetical protein